MHKVVPNTVYVVFNKGDYYEVIRSRNQQSNTIHAVMSNLIIFVVKIF